MDNSTLVALLALPVIFAVSLIVLAKTPQRRRVTVSVAQGPAKTPLYRHHRAKDELKTCPVEGVATVHDVLVYAAREHENREAFGSRRVLRAHEEEKIIKRMVDGKEVQEKKMWRYFELEPYSWLTYGQALEQAKTIGAGLVELGLKAGDKACIFASTSPEWQMFAYGCFSQSITIATAYDTLGVNGLLHSLNEPEIPALFCNAELLSIAAQVAEKTTHLRLIVYFGEPKQSDLDALHTASKGKIRTRSLEAVVQLGQDKPCEFVSPKSSDLCCIMYTSGTTGDPKGVMLTHGNLVAAVSGIDATIPGVLYAGDIFLAFLPLAHVLEFTMETYFIFKGISIGYGSPKTLTDASVRNCQGDIKELRPTIMAGVPAVWDVIKKDIISRVKQMPPTIQNLFLMAYKIKQVSIMRGLPFAALCDAIVFKKVQAQTGGRLRIALSGGAPISEETQLYLSTVICPIVQGYGMTETCGMCTLYSPETPFSTCNVGVPVACCEIKLVDSPEAGYTTAKNPPQGEIWLRGPSVTSGYFNQLKLTREVLTDDGWLQTGDIGEMHPDGTFNIIDRLKNLVKLSHGEYVALEKLESIYSGSQFVQRICVYADSFRAYCIAVVTPVPAAIERWARTNNGATSSHESWQQLCHSKAARNAVMADLLAIWKSNRLAPAEQMKSVILCDEEWTTHNFLTAAMKLKRRDIIAAFKKEINAEYK